MAIGFVRIGACRLCRPSTRGCGGGRDLGAQLGGPYPLGNPLAQPKLSLALPVAYPVVQTGVREQSFRMMVKPDIWGRQMRIPQTGGMRAEFIPDNTVGGPGDKLHPNRPG